LLLLCACQQTAWNDPYPASEAGANIFYGSFTERPKHLDPVRAYSANEYLFISQIYEPPLQYHFLKRPYELVPLSATAVPEPQYLDAKGQVLADDVRTERIATSVYRVHIHPGRRFQPHPAFARDDKGHYIYHDMSAERQRGYHTLADFESLGSRELTAADYVYQLKRLAHPRLNSPIAGLMSEYILGLPELAKRLHQAMADQVEGGFLDLRQYDFSGARVIDRYTYEVRIKGKYPQFIYWFAMPFFAPMPWEADRFYSQSGLIENNVTLDWFPVGTGAYMLTENNPNMRMVLQRNPEFSGEVYPAEGMPEDRAAGLLVDAGRSLPFIDKAVYALEKETIPYWNKFLQGYYDTSGISSDSFDQAVQFSAQGEAQLTPEMRARGIGMSTAVTTSTFYMGFNMSDPVVGGYNEQARKLRQAIAIAIDYEEFISIFANGRGNPAQGPIPPGIFGAIEGCAGINPYVYTCENGRPQRKSLDEALRLLTEAGYPHARNAVTGEPLVLYFDSTATGPDSKSLLDWLRKQFQKLGIQLVIRATDYNRFQEKMRKGTEQLFQWGWNADYPDPENFLFLLYGPNAKVEHGGENAANYANPAFDKLFVQMKDMANGPARQAVIDQMVGIVRRDAPWLWGYHPLGFSLHHAWYHNAKPNLMANNTLKYKRVDPQLRERSRRAWNQAVVWPLWLLLGLLLLSLIPAWVSYRRREKATAL